MADFEEIGRRIGAVVAQKNAQYGNSFARSGEFLRLLYPNGIAPEQYGDALLLVRVFDKQMRIANGHHEDSWADIVGYGILGQSVLDDSAQSAVKAAIGEMFRNSELSAPANHALSGQLDARIVASNEFAAVRELFNGSLSLP